MKFSMLMVMMGLVVACGGPDFSQGPTDLVGVSPSDTGGGSGTVPFIGTGSNTGAGGTKVSEADGATPDTIVNPTPDAAPLGAGGNPITTGGSAGSNGTAGDTIGTGGSPGTGGKPVTTGTGGNSTGGTGGTPICTPKSKFEACGTTICGPVDNGCGVKIDCTRTKAEACGPANCGSADNGCGGRFECGTHSGVMPGQAWCPSYNICISTSDGSCMQNRPDQPPTGDCRGTCTTGNGFRGCNLVPSKNAMCATDSDINTHPYAIKCTVDIPVNSGLCRSIGSGSDGLYCCSQTDDPHTN